MQKPIDRFFQILSSDNKFKTSNMHCPYKLMLFYEGHDRKFDLIRVSICKCMFSLRQHLDMSENVTKKDQIASKR